MNRRGAGTAENLGTMQELDARQQKQIEEESHKLRRRGEEFYVPLFKEFTRHVEGRPRTLSVGCGIAEDVDALHNSGFEAFGLDPGYRATQWLERDSLGRLVRGDGTALPFRDNVFDVVMSSGVIEHVGAVGSSLELQPDYYEQRTLYAREMVRVLKPGGCILIDTPNKRFPIDCWHGPYQLWGRWHSPWEKFLAGWREIKDLYITRAGAGKMETVSLRRFFVFQVVGGRALGGVAAVAARALFTIVDWPLLRRLRRSWLMPYLAIKITK